MKFDTLYTDMSYTILFLKYTECSNRHIILLILHKSTGVLILQKKRIFHAYRMCQELLHFFGGYITFYFSKKCFCGVKFSNGKKLLLLPLFHKLEKTGPNQI
jgi:hypothetical protein